MQEMFGSCFGMKMRGVYNFFNFNYGIREQMVRFEKLRLGGYDACDITADPLEE